MNLKQFREQHNLSQQAFANLIGVPDSTYQGWECGKYTPNKINREKLNNTIHEIIYNEMTPEFNVEEEAKETKKTIAWYVIALTILVLLIITYLTI